MILNVENLTHGFGDRAIFNNVSFRLLDGDAHTGRRKSRIEQACAGWILRPACRAGEGHDDRGCPEVCIFISV